MIIQSEVRPPVTSQPLQVTFRVFLSCQGMILQRGDWQTSRRLPPARHRAEDRDLTAKAGSDSWFIRNMSTDDVLFPGFAELNVP